VAHTEVRNTNKTLVRTPTVKKPLGVTVDRIYRNRMGVHGLIICITKVSRSDSYTEAMERSPMGGDNDGTQGFLAYAY
jgi:hypothetical protein